MEIPSHHHERWDGSGYPRGMSGEEIPLAARIFAVIDVADALSSKRAYHDAMPVERVYEYLENNAGVLFDPEIVAAFIASDLLRSETVRSGPEIE